VDHAKFPIAAAELPSGGAMIPQSKRRKVRTAALLGLLPGIGLAYAAPWPTVVVATLGVLVGLKVAGFFWLGVPFFICAAVASAVAGAMYAHRYNQTGRRTPLFAAERRLEARLRQR
jgi:hypothetical protein